jgi:hypothetical protein
MKRYGMSHKLLLAAWLIFCGCLVGSLMFFGGLYFAHRSEPMLAILLGVATIPFVWMLSTGWQDADTFKKALHMYVKEREKREV